MLFKSRYFSTIFIISINSALGNSLTSQREELKQNVSQDFYASSPLWFSLHGCFSASLPGLCPRDTDSPPVILLGYRNFTHRYTRRFLLQPCYQQPGQYDSYVMIQGRIQDFHLGGRNRLCACTHITSAKPEVPYGRGPT